MFTDAVTALFWSNTTNPCGIFRLGMRKRLDLVLSAGVPRPRTPADTSAPTTAEPR